jgi:undecaprenyl-diphosphatase
MNLIEAIILAIVEGLTEFLPVSSTGHMIIVSSLMGIGSDDFVKMFTIAIQFGAILSVIVLYWKRFFQTTDFYFKLLVGFIPAAVLGKLLNDFIDSLLESVPVVAASLLAGGILLLFVDKWFTDEKNNKTEVSYPTAFKIGLFQCIAMIPGVSRSAATIIGGMSQGLTRKTAAEFSFFLAVPTMFAATVYKMYKYIKANGFDTQHINLLIIGNVVAFIVAMLAIKFFISFLTKYGFKIFGYYRIALGLLLIALMLANIKLEIQ